MDTQILKVGQVLIAAVPGEFTTMAGRRLRKTITNAMKTTNDNSTANIKVTIAGLSNTYTHYITTHEEYNEQRYEAASTIYGPYTLMAYQQQYDFLARTLALDKVVGNIGRSPPNLHDEQPTFVPNILFDSAPQGHRFGDCLVQVNFSHIFQQL